MRAPNIIIICDFESYFVVLYTHDYVRRIHGRTKSRGNT